MKAFTLLILASIGAHGAEVSKQMLDAFAAYMAEADRSVQARASAIESREYAGSGAPVIRAWDKQNPREVPDGLIHDWVGTVFVPGAKVADAEAVLKDVKRYPQVYSGDVLSAKLLKQDGDRLKTSFRVIRKKVITVVLETDYDIEYRRISDSRTQVWSKSTRIAEVEDHGTAKEKVKPPDTGWGYLWRLHSYWHLEELEGGLLMEFRTVSLTRGIPTGLGLIIKPMVTSLPMEALRGTLEKTRLAVLSEPKRAAAGTPRPAVPPRAAPAAPGRTAARPL
jgi:hypothetical protein